MQALLLCVLCGIPEPYSELKLDDNTKDRIEAIVAKHEYRLKIVRRKRNKEDREKAVAQIQERINQEIEKLLTPQQKEQLAKVRDWMENGVPIGEGFRRSYKIEPLYYGSSGGAYSAVGYSRSIQNAASSRPDGITFDLIGNDFAYRSITLLVKQEQDGRTIAERVPVLNIGPGERHKIEVPEIDPRKPVKISVYHTHPAN